MEKQVSVFRSDNFFKFADRRYQAWKSDAQPGKIFYMRANGEDSFLVGAFWVKGKRP
jgi:hypothetical protein